MCNGVIGEKSCNLFWPIGIHLNKCNGKKMQIALLVNVCFLSHFLRSRREMKSHSGACCKTSTLNPGQADVVFHIFAGDA